MDGEKPRPPCLETGLVSLAWQETDKTVMFSIE